MTEFSNPTRSFARACLERPMVRPTTERFRPRPPPRRRHRRRTTWSAQTSARKSAQPVHVAFGSVVVFHVDHKPPAPSLTHNSNRPSGNGATANCRAPFASGPTSPKKSAHGVQFASGSVVVFHVDRRPPAPSVSQNSSRLSLKGATPRYEMPLAGSRASSWKKNGSTDGLTSVFLSTL